MSALPSPSTDPSTPPTLAVGAAEVVVPGVVGQRAEDAAGTISSSGFVISWSREPSPPETWIVIAQEPGGGRTGAPGSVVRLIVSPRDAAPAPTGNATTASGLTFDVAAAVCDAHGRNTSAGSWSVEFSPANAQILGDTMSLRADLAVPTPNGADGSQTVECVVAGTDIDPTLQSFWVH